MYGVHLYIHINTHRIFCVLSCVDGCLGCFYVMVIANSAAMNTEVHASFQIIVLPGYMPRNGAAESYQLNFQFFEEPPYCFP